MQIGKVLSTVQKHYYFPKFSATVFTLLFLVIAAIYNYQSILFKGPQSYHQWRQADCLSLATNYYQDDNAFLQPSIHNLCEDGTGKTVSDFPILYYTVGKIWQVFGHYEFIYRVIILLFFFAGLFALFKLMEMILKDSILALLLSLFLFTSPTLVYYANNFLMDIPAFALGLIGLYFFFRFYEGGKSKHLYLFASVYAIAGLLKTPALTGFCAILGLFFLELVGVQFRSEKKIFSNPQRQFIPLLFVLLIQVAWYSYASYYNATNNYGIFLIGILPIWELNWAEILVHLDAIREHIRWDYFRTETQVVLLLMFLSLFAFYKRGEKVLLYLTAILSFGFLMFVMLFFQPLMQHDYYSINLFVVAAVILLSFATLIKDRFPRIYGSVWVRVLVVGFLIHNIDFTRNRMNERYNLDAWINDNYRENLKAFETITPYLRSVGIKADDHLISLSDNSINISLYLMNQKGWTNYEIHSKSDRIKAKIDLGAKYILIYDKSVYANQDLIPFFDNKIGAFENIDIYAL